VLGALRSHLAASAGAVDEWLGNVSVQVEVPSRPSGPNVWLLFPTYHGERESFNGFCEDRPACDCTAAVGSCTHRVCRGKHLCKQLPATSARFVEHALSFSHALATRGVLEMGGSMAASSGAARGGGGVRGASTSEAIRSHPKQSRVTEVSTSAFYDDCWEGRGRCQGRRPCLEPGDQLLYCRATAMLCAKAPWQRVLAEAKAWIPSTHRQASLLYLYDGASQDVFDETFRTWSAASVGHGASTLVFGPQFASVRPRLLNHSLHLVAAAMRRSDACRASRAGAGAHADRAPVQPTRLLFRSPAFNLDPVNTYRQQANFGRRVRSLVEAAGAVFLDMYSATRHAALQHTPHAIRFDKFSTFHYFDAGRYLQAQILLHAMRLLSE